MKHDETSAYSPEVESGIARYLQEVTRSLKDGTGSASEIRAVVDDLELHVRTQLAQSRGRGATMPDLDAVLARMDPPEAFRGEATPGAFAPAPPVKARPQPLVLLAGVALAVVIGVVLYYMVIDASIFSRSAPDNRTPPGEQPDSRAIQPEGFSLIGGAYAESVTPDAASAAIPVAVASFAVSDNVTDRSAVQMAVVDGLINALATESGIRVVERAKIDEGLAELKMGAEGLLDQATALKLGKIIGARVIITGNIVKIGDQIVITARLINAETSELVAARVSGDRAQLLPLVDQLSGAVLGRIQGNTQGALARAEDHEQARVDQRRKELAAVVAGKPLPRLLIMLPETHLGGYVRDPAGETELVEWFTVAGFPVASPEYEGIKAPQPAQETTEDIDIGFRRVQGWRNMEGLINISRQVLNQLRTGALGDEREKLAQVADVIILGEGISERGTNRGGLISCKARLELKAVDIMSGRVLLARSGYGAGIDVAERIAGKKALQAAARDMAPQLVADVFASWTSVRAAASP